LLDWCLVNVDLAKDYLKETVSISDNLWVKFTMTNEVLGLLKDEKSMEILQEISESNVSLSDVKQLMSIASELDSLGVSGFAEILSHAADLLDVEKDFHFLRETGENIETVFKEAINSETLKIGMNHLSKGSHDFEIYSLSEPEKKVFVEIKSYKHNTTYPFKFASSQIKKSIEAPGQYFVCMLERPQNNAVATTTYLKDKLYYRSNLDALVNTVMVDIDAFEHIQYKSGDVKLVLNMRDRPRVHVSHQLMKQEVNSFNSLVLKLKEKLA
jgi:hypothetical protein